MNIDSLLRETLHSCADDAPPSVGLLGGARARAHHHRRIRRVTVSGIGAAVAVAIAVPVLLTGGGEGDRPTDPAPTASSVLAPPSYELPSFPFTPGWVPAGIEDAYRVGSGQVLQHDQAGNPGAAPALITRIWPADPGEDLGVDADDERDVTVRGRPGRMYADRWRATVIWQHDADRWVSIDAFVELSPEELVRYADELTRTPARAEPPFTFALLPVGAELQTVSDRSMGFSFGDDGRLVVEHFYFNPYNFVGYPCFPTDGTEPAPLPATPGDGSTAEPMTRTRVEVGGREADLEVRDGRVSLCLIIDPAQQWRDYRWALRVETDSLSAADLVRLAEGIQLTPAALPPAEAIGGR